METEQKYFPICFLVKNDISMFPTISIFLAIFEVFNIIEWDS